MGLKKCPVCGEKFADTYKRCPFCEEDENPRRAKQPKRYEGSGRRLARRDYEEETSRPVYGDEDYRPRRSAEEEDYRPRRSAPEEYRDDDTAYRGRRSRRDDYDDGVEYKGRRSRRDDYDDYDDGYDDYDDEDRGSPWFKVVLVILLAIIIACLLYLFRGPIGDLISGGDNEPDPPSSSMTSDNEPEDPNDTVITDPNAGTEPDVNAPEQTDDLDNGETDTPDTPAVTGGLTLSHEDVSIAGDEKLTLSARSGSGDVTFASKDPAIATVSAGGVVTGVKKGTTEITVQRGSEKAVCIVRVKSDGKSASAGTETNTGDSGTVAAGLTLSHEDVTIAAGEKFTLSARSGSGGATFTSKDPSIATVSAGGVVTGVKKGLTEITVRRGSEKAVCIVRVK